MARKRSYWAHALSQSFFTSSKVEWGYKNHCNGYSDAEIPIFKWIETWYISNRRHSALNYNTIRVLELEMWNQKLAA